ncbi:hypothetical protein [Streptomyces sp. NPDC006324]
MQFGILAGYEMTGVRVILLDGGYHEVDCGRAGAGHSGAA